MRFGMFHGDVFRGSLQSQWSHLENTILAIRALRGNIDLPLKPFDQGRATRGIDGDITGFTPLMLAMLSQDFGLLHVLIGHGADARFHTSTGKTALMCLTSSGISIKTATEMKYLKVIELLVKNGADINARISTGQTAISSAASRRYHSVVDFYLEKGVDPEAVDWGYHTHSIWACFAWQAGLEEEDILTNRLLQRHVFSLNDHEKRHRIIENTDEKGPGLLHYFARAGMVHCVKGLLEAGCEINKLYHSPHGLSKEDYQKPTRVFRDKTPLDMVVERRDGLEGPNKLLREKFEAVISVLRQVGAIEVRHSSRTESKIEWGAVIPLRNPTPYLI